MLEGENISVSEGEVRKNLVYGSVCVSMIESSQKLGKILFPNLDDKNYK
jgi:hypothetical protein